MSTHEEKISTLVTKRAGLKSYIAVCMDKLQELYDENLKIHFKNRKAAILGHLHKV